LLKLAQKHEIDSYILLSFIIEIEIYEWGGSSLWGPLPSSLKKVKFFIHGAILLKFETNNSQ